MAKKWIFFIISVAAIAAFLGCHAGGSAPFVNTPSESDIISFEREVDKNGRFADIIFPSGAVIKCTQDGTLKKGTKVTVTEQKTSKDTPAYIYNITAKLYNDDALNTAVSANTLEKPISVTLPNNSTSGTCYIGTRANQNDPWRYSLASDGITSNARFIRLSANPPKTCSFNLYRLAIEFALFVLNNQSKEETLVDSVEITPEKEVETKDGKYAGALTVKMNVEGENLNNIDPAKLVARIIYRSENKDGANINFATNKTDSEDNAVSGIYEHTFEITKIDKTSIGNTAELTFELNLDGVSLADFPSNFIVELYSKSDDKNTLPFTYTQEFGFETKENQDNPDNPDPDPQPGPQPTGSYSIKYELNGGKLAEGVTNPSSYNEDSDTIKLNNPTKDGYTFIGWSGTDLTGDTNKEVKIAKGSTGDREYKANWQQNAPDEYTLTLLAGTGIASVDDEKAYKKDTSITLNCTVIDGYQFDKWSDSEGNAVTSPFTMPANAVALTANAKVITYNITYQNTDGATFATANPTNYTVETADFTLTNPIKDDSFFLGWTYEGQTTPQLEVTITKGSTTGAKTYTANWEAKAVASLKSATTDSAVDGQIQIEFDKEITWQDSYKSKITVTPINSTTAITTGSFSYSNKILTIRLSDNLKYNSSYSVSISDLNKVVNNSFNFQTKSLTVQATVLPDSSTIDTLRNNRYILNPVFSIDFGKRLADTTDVRSKFKFNNGSLPNDSTLVFDSNNRVATLTFVTNLEYFTDYTLEIASYTDTDNSTINGKELAFKTVPSDAFSGNGIIDDPFLIYNGVHLNKVREYVGSATVYYFKQMDDIVLTGNWFPIGDNTNKFTGYYDGNSKTIFNLSISFESTNNEKYNNGYVGLFGDNAGTITNLTLDRASISLGVNNYGSYYVGCFAGNNKGGIIEKCKVTNSSMNLSSTNSNFYVGGICGYSTNNGNVTYCNVESTTINVSSTGEHGNVRVGGICGYFGKDATFTGNNVKNTTISGSGTETTYVGGIYGNTINPGPITNCSVVNDSGSHKISGSSNSDYGCYVGGICGQAYGNITSCYVKGYEIEGTCTEGCYVGGICGNMSNGQSISNSYVESVSLSASGNVYLGGISGSLSSRGNISNCYVYEDENHSISIVNGSGYLGYLLGRLYKDDSDPASNATIKDSFYNGTASKLSDLVNRVGKNDSTSLTPDDYGYVINCYGGVNSKLTFQSKTWSDNLNYTDEASFNNANSVWKDFDFSNWPPRLKQN